MSQTEVRRGFLALCAAGTFHLSLVAFIAIWGGRHLTAGTTWQPREVLVMVAFLTLSSAGYAWGILLAARNRRCRRLFISGVLAFIAVSTTVITNVWPVALRENLSWGYNLANNSFFIFVPLVMLLAIQWAVSGPRIDTAEAPGKACGKLPNWPLQLAAG